MKIVCISDTHGDHLLLKSLPEGDILIHAGDFTGYGTSKEVFKFNKWLGTLPYKHIIIIAGNHDKAMEKEAALSYFTNAHYLQDTSIELEGIKFYGSPYTPIFMRWYFMDDEKGLARRYENIPLDTDVVITHGPMRGIMDYVDNEYAAPRNVGSTSLFAKISSFYPKFHICGHIHSGHGVTTIGNGLGKQTTCINASLLDEAYDMVYSPITFDI